MNDASLTTVSSIFAHACSGLNRSRQILVGYSGGLDSTVLLHLACGYFTPQRIMAVHINHALCDSAQSWQEHARRNCAALSVSFSAHRVDCRQKGNLEASARSERYAIFRQQILDGGILLLGHHANDQVETVLYRLMRGSGSRGLAGMPKMRKLGVGELLRPLLGVMRRDLLAYAQCHKLVWVDDHSNADVDLDRNFLRHRIVPALAERWPDYAPRISSSAARSREAEALAQSVFRSDLNSLDKREERSGMSIGISQLSGFDPPRQRNIVRCMPAELNLPTPSLKIVTEVLKTLANARIDALPVVVSGSYQYRRYRHRLYVVSVVDEPNDAANVVLKWQLNQPLTLPGGHVLISAEDSSDGLRLSASSTVEIGFRRGGERCRPAGRGHSQRLKKLLQEYALEPWWRASVPLLFVAGEIVAVGDLWVCEGWQAKGGECGLKICWSTNSA